ncbi:MAG: hypothetical protein V7606_584 [Burkholderiales bacterium]
MNILNKNQAAWMIAAIAALSVPAHAHDAWTEARGEGYAVVFGHDGKLEKYAPSKVKAIAAVDAKGAALNVKQQTVAEVVTFTVAGKPVLATLRYDNGFWSKTTDGSKNLPKNEVPGAISGSHAVKFGKTLYTWAPAVTKPQGQQLEIVPLSATAPAAGKTMPVQVMWQGKPLAGAKVVRADTDQAPVATDAQGKAAVAVGTGRQMLTVSHKHDLANDPRADTYSVSANLMFEIR